MPNMDTTETMEITDTMATRTAPQMKGAAVTEKIYPNMGHTISLEEINVANAVIFN